MKAMREKLIRKIKKLLALAGSPNANEAAAALNKAQALMAEHNLTHKNVDLESLKESNPYRLRGGAKVAPNWVQRLMRTVGDSFGVKPIIYTGVRKVEGRTISRENRVAFVGLAERSELAAYAFMVLYRQLIRARSLIMEATLNLATTKRSDRIKRADWFCDGWVVGAAKIIRQFEMTDYEKDLLEAWTQAKNITTAGTRKVETDPDAYRYFRAGEKEGRQASLYRPVGGMGPGIDEPAQIAWGQ